MADYPPFMNAYGLVSKILEKIKHAKTPDRFTQDFLGTNLGFPSGSAKPFIPLAKRMGLLSSDGVPTELYKSFRNSAQSKRAMANAIRKGYSQLYDRNEYAHKLDKASLTGLVMEATGLEKDNASLRAICGTFEALKSFADFDAADDSDNEPSERETRTALPEGAPDNGASGASDFKMNLAYTINLVLPKTDDVAVFNAIFKSLREHLVRR